MTTAHPFLGTRLTGARARIGIVIIGIIGLGRRRFRLPRLPGCRKQGQLIGRKLLALAIAFSIQQLTQKSLDFVPLAELAIELRHQIQHHLLEDLGIFWKMFWIVSHE